MDQVLLQQQNHQLDFQTEVNQGVDGSSFFLNISILDCGTRYNPIKIRDFVSTPKSEVKIHEMPWMVSIVAKSNPTTAACSASLVASKFIITAAHCFKHEPKEAFEVVLGTDDLSDDPSNYQPYQKKLDIFKLHQHPNYTGMYHYDIAIVELENEVPFNEGIYPICLPTAGAPIDRADHQVTLAGFGSTDNGQQNRKLHFTSLQIIDQRTCNREYQQRIGVANLFTTNLLCAGSFVRGTGSCPGDSGGPLYKVLSYEGYSEQIAVTKGGDARTACGSFPGIYTRLDDPVVFDWIRRIL